MRLEFYVVLFILGVAESLQCYSGFTYIRGEEVGTTTVECTSASDQCYNATGDGGSLAVIQAAGCSTAFCALSRNSCMQQSLLGHSVTFCCCNTGDLCNSKYTGMNTLEKGASKLSDFIGGLANFG